MKLTNWKIENLFNAMRAVEPIDEQNKKSPYNFKGKVRSRLVKNLWRLKNAYQELLDIRNAMIQERLEEGETELPPEKLQEFRDAFQEVYEDEVDVTLYPINEKDLNLDKNQIPIGVLSDLYGTVINLDEDEEPNSEDKENFQSDKTEEQVS